MAIKSIAVIPEVVNIYRRYDGGPYQARIKLEKGNWHRVTTGEIHLDDAKEKALELYYQFRYRKKNELPQVNKKCSSVARFAVAVMQKELDEGVGKSVYKDYIRVIERFFIPFFGKHSITSLTPSLLAQFDVFRTELLGKSPSSSTLNTHNSAINRVLQVALDRGWLAKSQMPVLTNHGKRASARPTFSLSEYRLLHRRMREWCTTGHQQKSRMIRELLRDYVLILANTGMRHGTESLNLKWKHIEWYTNTRGERFLQITVDGKTGNRQLIARNSVLKPLQRIQSRFADIAGMSFDQLLANRVDEYVFRLSNGERTFQMDRAFNQFLRQNDLLIGSTSDAPRSLYSLRHFYATIQLLNGREIHKLAIQMGTSVGMLEKHYSKLTPLLLAREFAGD